jgi:acyl-CoA synthetase (NDP forming)
VPTLSEAASKDLLRAYGVPVLAERTAADADSAVAAGADLGFPVVVKLCGDAIAHKTERGLVRLGSGNLRACATAATQLLAAARQTTATSSCSSPMVSGTTS